MAFQTEIKNKIPARLQTRDFKVFYDLIKRKSLTSYDKCRDYMNSREKELKDWIKNNEKSGSTMNRWMSRKKNELDVIRICKKTFLKYLR